MKKIYMIFFLVLTVLAANAQIHLTPVIYTEVDGASERTDALMESKLRLLLSSCNVLSKFGNSRFVLAARFNVVDKQIVSSAPMQVVYNIQADFAVGDGESGTCFGTETIELKGIGQTEERAILYGMQQLGKNTPELTKLIGKATQRIIEYYDANGKNIILRAKSLATAGNYEEAIYELSLIPRECKYYTTANNMLNAFYKQNIDTNAAKLLTKAKALWASQPTMENAITVMELLEDISPSASCYGQVQALIKEVKERNIKVMDKEQNHQYNMEKTRMKTIENIAVAYAKSRPKIIYNIRGWW